MGQYADLFESPAPASAPLAVRLSADTSPDRAAQALQVARRFQLPPGVAETFVEDYKARALTEDSRAAFERAPRLGSWVSQNQVRAAAAQDDIGTLAEIERAVGGLTSYVMGSRPDGGLPNQIVRGIRQIGAGMGPQFGANFYGAAAYPFEAVGLDRAGEFLRNEQRAAQAVAERVAGPANPEAGIFERGVMSGLRSAGQQIPSLGVGLAGAGAAATLGIMGAGTFGATYGKGRDAGLPVGQAGFYGLEDATAEVVTERFAGAFGLLADAKAGMGAVKMFVRDIAREIPGEMGATLWQNFNEWQNLNPDKSLRDFLAEQPAALAETIIATIVGAGAQTGALRGAQAVADRFGGEDRRAQQAEQAAADAEALAKLAEASKLRGRDAESFREFVQQVADEEGDAPTEFYIDGAVLANTLNQSGVTMQELEAIAPVVASQLEAAMTGGDVRVPVSEFLTAGEALTAPLVDHLRMTPDGMSRAEAQDYMKEHGDRIQREVEAELQRVDDQAQFRQSIEAVRAEFEAELGKVKRFTADVNRAYADLLANFYGATAARLGMTPQELLAKYRLRVQSKLADGQRVMEQGAPDTPEFRNWFGDSRVVDEQGKPLVVYHGTNKDFGTFSLAEFGRTDGGWAGRGFYFTERANEAAWYAHGPRGDATGGNVMPVYLTAKNPLRWKLGTEAGRAINAEKRARGPEGFAKWVQEQGYDSIRMTSDPIGSTPGEDQWIVFKPEQIKSAIGNRGTFDPADPSILNQGAAATFFQAVAEYQGSHKPPGPDSASLDDLTKNGVYPDDVYGPNGARWYGDGTARDAVAFAMAHRFQGRPNASVTIYRAVPYEKTNAEKQAAIRKQLDDYMSRRIVPREWGGSRTRIGDEQGFYDWASAELKRLQAEPQEEPRAKITINAGDWVTLTKDYAKEHGEGALGGNYKIISKTVKASEVFTNGDSIQEWGYWPANTYEQDKRPAAVPGEAPRAQIAFPTDITASPSVISLLQGADLSSFIHESGHFFLEVHADLATKIQQQIASGASVTAGERQIVEDFNRLLEWFGVKGDENLVPLQAWALMSLEEKRQYHEQFARGFEAYAFDGKAPSLELQSVFQRFRSWLLQVYQTLRNLKVELNDDVRAVMGRMLASDFAIEEAEAARNMGPLFKDAESAGMTLDEFNAYQGLARGATEDAIAQLQARGLKDMRWLSRARDKALKARQQEVEELRREVRQEIRAEVLTEPVYRAWQFLTGRVSDADKVDAPAVRKSVPGPVDNTVDSMFVAIAKMGGLRRDAAAADLGIDPKQRSPMPLFGKPLLLRDGGLTQDAMAERLGEQGYLTLDENGKVDIAEFQEKFQAELRGIKQYSYAKDYADAQGLAADAGLNIDGAERGKLDLSALIERYGPADARIAKLKALRMTAKAGWDFDAVAENFGFDSGDALVTALTEATPPAEAIEARTDQRMLEMFGDITSPQALQRAADEAVHNEARARVIAAELKALQDANTVREDTGKRTKQGRKVTVDVMARAAKDYAQQIISRLKVRELRPGQYAAAEARNAKLAEKAFASGKTDEAAMHKRNQLVNNHAAKAAYDAQAEVKQIAAYFRRFEKRPKSVDPGYLDQIDALLERFDFRNASLKAIDRRKSFKAWYDDQVADGLVPDISDELLDEANRKSYKDMTVEELRGLRDAVKNIEHLGKVKNRLLTARDQRTFDAAAEDIAGTVRQFGGKPREVKLEGEKGFRYWLEGVAAMHRKLSSLFRQMDGGRDDGPLYEHIVRPMNERGAWEDSRIEQATVALSKLYAPLLKMRGGLTGTRSKVFIPEINASLTRGGRLAVALNCGNEDNRQRIMAGDKWSEGQVRAILATLTKQELEFVNGVWEFIDSYWPEIAAKEKRVTGIAPEKVKAEPFTVQSSDGATVQMRGGYYPLKYDTDRSDRAESQEAAQVAKEMMRGAMTRATTRRGHTKERVKEVKRAVRKDLGVITQHVKQVVHDLAWHEWLIDTNRLLRDERVVGAIREHYGPKVLKTIRDDVAGIATADVLPMTDVDKALLLARSNVSRATMGASITTAFLQPFGLTQSMARIGSGHVLRGAARWMGDAAKLESSLTWIREKSEFMRLRSKTFNRELREVSSAVEGKTAAMRAIDGGLFWLMQKMQLVADVPTWIGQYEKTLAQHPEIDETDEAAVARREAEAVSQADRAVIEAQGSGQPKDLAEIQRKYPLLTQFYSYFSVTANLIAEKTATTDFKNPRAVAGWLGDMALLAVIPAIVPALLMHLLRGGGEDDEPEEWAKRIVQWQVGYLLGAVVGLRELSGAVQGFDYSGPPVGRIVGDITKAGKQTAQGDVDEPMVLAYVNLLGTALGIPVVQLTRSYRGWKAWDEGDSGPQAILLGPPPKE